MRDVSTKIQVMTHLCTFLSALLLVASVAEHLSNPEGHENEVLKNSELEPPKNQNQVIQNAIRNLSEHAPSHISTTAASLTTTNSQLPIVQCPGNQVKLESGGGCGCPSNMVRDGVNCTCAVGFTLEGAAGCKDVNECEGEGPCGLHASCTNILGSYSCSCHHGYLMGAAGCQDVDECALAAVTGLQACKGDAECKNTPGSFSCLCPLGFVMALNGQSCVDVDECSFEEECRRELGNVCVNTPGSFVCKCQPGFRAEAPACVDVDECKETPAVCDGQGVCENTLGSFKCVCQPGYQGNGTHCEDENECASGDHGCDTNARCGNIIGSYFCQCYQGFNGDGHSCFDVDECAVNNGHCEHNCTNEPGGHQGKNLGEAIENNFLDGFEEILDHHPPSQEGEAYCQHRIWWKEYFDYLLNPTDTSSNEEAVPRDSMVGSPISGAEVAEVVKKLLGVPQGPGCCGTVLVDTTLHDHVDIMGDVNECLSLNGTCEHICINIQGSFQCSCRPGFQLHIDGHTCVDIDECKLQNGGCSHTCTNSPGGHSCHCPPPLLLDTDNLTCSNVSSCKLRNGGCDHICTMRAEGHLQCSCWPGWKLSKDLRSCVDVDECGDFTNGGCEQLCVNHPGGFNCSCREGYNVRTDDTTKCQPVCDPPCQNYGVCVAPNGCDCPPGYPGLGCSAMCSPPCAHGGTCMRWNKCLCPPGWTGEGCHTAVCELPCTNGGRCVGPDTCQCPSDYTGPQCLLPLCTPACQNGGSCVDVNKCTCTGGWQGARCQIEPVQCHKPCKNGGMCEGLNRCRCAKGFTGSLCETAVTTPCVPPCQHGATCSPHNTCTCPEGTTGLRCERLTCPVVTTVVSMARAVRKAFRESYVDRCGPLGVQLCTKYRMNQARVYLQAYRVGYKIQCPERKTR
ncbi:uncharacterized protein ACBR49_008224 [Aulostomus maculatus]